jgi:hypothetical protein
MIYQMKQLTHLSLHHNQLTDVPGNAFSNLSLLDTLDVSYNQLTSFELWTFFVQSRVDFSHNRISTITNRFFFDLPLHRQTDVLIYLDNNSAIMDLTDTVYEMYNSCDEVLEVLEIDGTVDTGADPMLAKGLASISFGSTKLNCNCDLSHVFDVLSERLGGSPWSFGVYPLFNTSCVEGSFFGQKRCATRTPSTAKFSQVYPRQCKINMNETGLLTVKPNFTEPIVNTVNRLSLFRSLNI